MPSPYRIQLRPSEKPHKEFTCKNSIKTLVGAKRHCLEWAKDVVDGHIRVIGADGKVLAAANIRDGAVSHWLF